MNEEHLRLLQHAIDNAKEIVRLLEVAASHEMVDYLRPAIGDSIALTHQIQRVIDYNYDHSH